MYLLTWKEVRFSSRLARSDFWAENEDLTSSHCPLLSLRDQFMILRENSYEAIARVILLLLKKFSVHMHKNKSKEISTKWY